MIERSQVQLPAGALPGSLGQLSLPFSGVGIQIPAYWVGLRGGGAFTCVWWQVTLCDPIWQVTPRSCEIGFQLAPRSMTLDDLELDGGRSPLFSNT